MVGPPAASTAAGGPERKKQIEFARRVREEIDKLFADRKIKLRALRDLLLERSAALQPDRTPPNSPGDLLVPRQTAFDVKSSIDDLHSTVETCLQQLSDQGSSEVSAIVSGATEVLGWLALLAVSETWLQEQSGLLDRLLIADHVSIPLQTDVGTEVVFARLRAKRPARLTLDKDGVQIFNPNRLEWVQLELGISRTDRIMEIRKLIWKEIMKSDAPSFGQGELEELKETLQTRYERGESYYIIIRNSSNSSVVSDDAILMQLRSDFPHLCAFLIGAQTDERVLVVPERRLVVLVREFLLMLRKYHP